MRSSFPRLLNLPLSHKPQPRHSLFRIHHIRSLSSAMVTAWTPNTYPSARRTDHVDVYKSAAKGEVKVHDPYDWLEHHTEETEKWTTAQEAFTRQYLDKNPDRQNLENEIRKNTDYAKVDATKLTYFGAASYIMMCSSRSRASRMTGGGTGTTIPAYKPSQVRSAGPALLKGPRGLSLTWILPVIYRSNDSKLPALTGKEEPGGEVYFDVSLNFWTHHSYSI